MTKIAGNWDNRVYRCDQDGCINTAEYVVRDVVWNEAGAMGTPCLICFQSMLGRSLKLSDFTEARANQLIQFIWCRALENEEESNNENV